MKEVGLHRVVEAVDRINSNSWSGFIFANAEQQGNHVCFSGWSNYDNDIVKWIQSYMLELELFLDELSGIAYRCLGGGIVI